MQRYRRRARRPVADRGYAIGQDGSDRANETADMFREFKRPITNDERIRLLESIPAPRSFWRDWGPSTLIVLCLLPLVWLFVAWRMGQRDAWIFTAIYALMNAGFIGIPGWSDWRDRRIGAQAHRQLKRLLESAVEVTVQRVETEKVVEILGDEVDLYLFELEGRRYFVGDKWTLDSPRQGRGAKWPNSCFELIRIPGSIEEFGPFCYGRKIEPFESLDFRDVDLDKLSGDSRLFHGSLDSLRLGSTEA